MRDKNRIKPFTDELAKLWETRCPDLRFQQLINIIFSACEYDPFFYEDDEMLDIIKELLEEA